jgi:hypothetical protein
LPPVIVDFAVFCRVLLISDAVLLISDAVLLISGVPPLTFQATKKGFFAASLTV